MNIEIKAPAKVNLFLNVLGKRTDGYHDIQSVMTPVSVFDNLAIETKDAEINTVMAGGTVELDGIPWPASMPSPENNLVSHAAKALKSAAGYQGGARITIEKNIPVAGGLGGGSSDAAAALKGLNTAWRTGLSPEALMKLAEGLGSDVPAMVHGGIVKMEGRGEIITAVPPPPARSIISMLLVNPGLEVSTGDIYSRYKKDLTSPDVKDKFNLIISGLQKGCLDTIARGLFNSLQETAFCKYPLLRLIKDKLDRAGAAGVLLSGSGATILALVRDRKQGSDMEKRVRKALRCPLWTSLVEACPMV